MDKHRSISDRYHRIRSDIASKSVKDSEGVLKFVFKIFYFVNRKRYSCFAWIIYIKKICTEILQNFLLRENCIFFWRGVCWNIHKKSRGVWNSYDYSRRVFTFYRLKNQIFRTPVRNTERFYLLHKSITLSTCNSSLPGILLEYVSTFLEDISKGITHSLCMLRYP